MVIDFFAAIHEFAVLGTTFFMLALATLWYSPLLFGTLWSKVSGTTTAVFDETAPEFMRQLGTAFASYLVQVALLAWVLSYAPMVGVSPWLVAILLSVFTVAVTAPLSVYEEKNWQYFSIHSGFMVVFIFISVAALTYWPW